MQSLRKTLNTTYARMTLRFDRKPVEYYAGLIEKGVPFSFSRYGDGEWSAIFSKKGQNCDGHIYYPELGAKLRDALTGDGSYFYAMQNYALRTMGFKICKFLKQNAVRLTWHQSDVFHYANRDGELAPFINALRKKELIFVGPAYLRAIDRIFPNAKFIEIPQQNCFLALDVIKNQMLDAATRHENAVFSLSASMAANVLVHELHPSLGANHWLLDLGSLWDVYVDKQSREHYKSGYDWQAIMAKNLAGL